MASKSTTTTVTTVAVPLKKCHHHHHRRRRRRLPNELLSELVDWLPMAQFIGPNAAPPRLGAFGQMHEAQERRGMVRNGALDTYLDRVRRKYEQAQKLAMEKSNAEILKEFSGVLEKHRPQNPQNAELAELVLKQLKNQQQTAAPPRSLTSRDFASIQRQQSASSSALPSQVHGICPSSKQSAMPPRDFANTQHQQSTSSSAVPSQTHGIGPSSILQASAATFASTDNSGTAATTSSLLFLPPRNPATPFYWQLPFLTWKNSGLPRSDYCILKVISDPMLDLFDHYNNQQQQSITDLNNSWTKPTSRRKLANTASLPILANPRQQVNPKCPSVQSVGMPPEAKKCKTTDAQIVDQGTPRREPNKS